MRRSCARMLGRWLVVCLGAAGCGGDEGGLVDGTAGSQVDVELDGADGDPSSAHGRCDGEPGAAGIGDPYFPGSGNGGYAVDSYHLRVSYDPSSDELVGEATITARAEQDLSRFNLDLDGLTVDAVKVDGRGAKWSRDGGELSISPARCIRKRARFEAVVRYHGIPEPVSSGPLGGGGFLHTDVGALVVGEPQVAARWFPVNDHPRDDARFTVDITGPADLDVVAVGRLVERRTRDGLTTWRWRAREPMAPYLFGWTMGHYEVDEYRDQGLSFVDAIDVDLFTPPVLPRTGENVAVSGQADSSWKRITRTIAVPATGGELSFHVLRDTEPDFDFFFVEAHVVGSDEWTTLPDADGIAQQSVGLCTMPIVHPFALKYFTLDDSNPEQPCLPTGLTGAWWAASGTSEGWEQWRVDLSPYAGQEAEISLSYAGDEAVQGLGVAVDDIAFATGEGTTSFEGGDTGGWQVPGAPPPDTVNANDWFVGGVADLPPSAGDAARATLARQGEIIAFEADLYGDYPFRDAGAILHDSPEVGFALENQTRPIYSGFFFGGGDDGVGVVVHELAHQWVGDLVRLDEWQHIWLNEGFASYTEWLWSEHEGLPADVFFDFFYEFIDPADPFWQVVIGDPGPDTIFDGAVYIRGAMTLHQLRRTVGDDDFFCILRRWTERARAVTTAEFIALAEEVSGRDLDELFDPWLFTAGRPEPPPATQNLTGAATDAAALQRVGKLARSMLRSSHLRR